ncbi:MAG: hypothetical protein JWL82_136 [Parcubacteria group bacterium]|nr:hypothetical protein [Parcubacteria group bacterium]
MFFRTHTLWIIGLLGIGLGLPWLLMGTAWFPLPLWTSFFLLVPVLIVGFGALPEAKKRGGEYPYLSRLMIGIEIAAGAVAITMYMIAGLPTNTTAPLFVLIFCEIGSAGILFLAGWAFDRYGVSDGTSAI